MSRSTAHQSINSLSKLGYTPVSLVSGAYISTSTLAGIGLGGLAQYYDPASPLTHKQKTTKSLHKWLKDNLVPRKA